jgi:hypothetical protein
MPVADLILRNQNQKSHLEFSADPARSYVVEASTNLTQWTTIGTPVPGGDVGEFDFDDVNASQFTVRFHRVVT